ncbi:kinase-like domain-containing protein [Lasiosphaeria ovina]|uniref:Kinase-like domain-containing protein n=1 Tax=Lasiosphaeria ovina TaxID=92902 RepID=A0AAE0N031_9PEZI|nr:kinase-like domain-containing protein [Lasiosphaeria ovina]
MEDTTFVTLTPVSALAKLALSDIVETHINGRQNKYQADDAPLLKNMAVELAMKYDSEVFRLRREITRRGSLEGDSNTGYASESFPESESEAEGASSEDGMVWAGHFFLDFNTSIIDPQLGWTVGRRSPDSDAPSPDLSLCRTSFAKQHHIGMRIFNARFNFAPDTRGLCISLVRGRASARLTVDGTPVKGKLHSLNKHKSVISFGGQLDYELEYTPFASGKDNTFYQLRNKRLEEAGAPEHVDVDMRTPLQVTRTIGPWTVGKPLGRGGQGRVFFGSNSDNEAVALKIVQPTTDDEEGLVLREVSINEMLTNLAQEKDTAGRILRQVEVIYSNSEVVSVHKPVVGSTFCSLIPQSSENDRGMSMEAARVFRDALLGVQILHHAGWVHRDLKPANIGLIGTPQRSVLLDNGTAGFIGEPGGFLRPMPACGGTIPYLAPEREMEPYNYSVDIWAMGVIGYGMMYGKYPFVKFSQNPWRFDRRQYEYERRLFAEKYEESMATLAGDYYQACNSPVPGYIHLGALLKKMLRYQWAKDNNETRINIDEVLSDPNWRELGELPDVSRAEAIRVRLEYINNGREKGGPRPLYVRGI